MAEIILNWLEKEIAAAKREVDSWPEWKRNEMRRVVGGDDSSVRRAAELNLDMKS